MKKQNTVETSLCNAIVMFELLSICAIILMILQGKYMGNFGNTTIIYIIIVLSGMVLAAFTFRQSLKKLIDEIIENALEEESGELQESIKYVQENVCNKGWVKINPIKDEPQHENFATQELQKRGQFYAMSMKAGTIVIAIQFNGEHDKIYYGGLNAENFTEYYEVKA